MTDILVVFVVALIAAVVLYLTDAASGKGFNDCIELKLIMPNWSIKTIWQILDVQKC